MPAACDSVLEDIEDIVSAQDLKPRDWQFVRKNVFPKVRKRSSQQRAQTDDDPPHDRYILPLGLSCLFLHCQIMKIRWKFPLSQNIKSEYLIKINSVCKI